MSINRVNITGNLTRDPELRATEGKLRYSSWERDGQKRSKLEVIVDEIEFMNSRPAASPAAAVDGGQQYAVPEALAVEVADEDIPF